MKRAKLFIDAGPILETRLSGIGHVTLRMIQALAKHNDYDIRLLAPAAKAHLLNQWQLPNVRVVRVPFLARIWNNWPRVRFMPPIDVLFGRGLYVFPNFKRWTLAFSPSITYVHDISFELFPQFTEPRNLRMLAGNVARWAQASTLVVTDSKTSRQEILDHYHLPADKVKAIYCGVDESFKPATTAQVAAVRKKYDIARPYFLFLSNLEPRKNIARLIQALGELPANYKKKYSLVLVGGMGWQNTDILTEITQAKAAGWDIIKPTTYVPDEEIPALLTGAELLVHPALHEGFGMPVVEAMACRTPVVASDIPVLREIASNAALYADPYNTVDIAAKIEQVVTDTKLRQSLVVAGEKTAQKFTWDAAAGQLLAYSKNIRP